jgi:hypothetical protein
MLVWQLDTCPSGGECLERLDGGSIEQGRIRVPRKEQDVSISIGRDDRCILDTLDQS